MERCNILARVIVGMKALYEDPQSSRTQRDLLETMIGAAIWYLPQPDDLWTQNISADALKALQAGSKVTRDHNYPRKCAARELLCTPEEQLTADFVLHRYKTKYGTFNLVTKEENRRLMKYQKADLFRTPEEAYSKAAITLVPVRSDQGGKLTLRVASAKVPADEQQHPTASATAAAADMPECAPFENRLIKPNIDDSTERTNNFALAPDNKNKTA